MQSSLIVFSLDICTRHRMSSKMLIFTFVPIPKSVSVVGQNQGFELAVPWFQPVFTGSIKQSRSPLVSFSRYISSVV